MIDIKYYWQISKYKEQELPLYGKGTILTWTSVSDIGKVINEKNFTVNDYLTVENLYIQVIRVFMMCSNTNSLIVNQLEKPFSLEEIKESTKKKGLNDGISNELFNFYQLINEGEIIGIREVEYVSRLALRENLWAQLQCESMFVRFDYDYYMDIGSLEICERLQPKYVNGDLL